MSTLLKPPPNNDAVSSMENTLELMSLEEIGPDLFTNRRPLWHPPGARGLYGGAIIAQTLAAAQLTVPKEFAVHSMHCYFVLAGSSEMPVVYHVERVREGRSFATRTVQARQKGRPIFTTTLSFMREGSAGEKTVQHDSVFPKDLPELDESIDQDAGSSPFIAQHTPMIDGPTGQPSDKRARIWMKARGQISQSGSHQAHLAALAYMTDSFFIGTVARAHKLWRHFKIDEKPRPFDIAKDDEKHHQQRMKIINGGQEKRKEDQAEVGMMVSLDHTIYFHRPKDFRADDWLISEMDTPWSGDGRGLVAQRIWTKDGKHVATCFQEGLVRLKQPKPSKI